jgi:hypothetical protein
MAVLIIGGRFSVYITRGVKMEFQIFEMASEPKTKKKADRLALILPANIKEARENAKKFWDLLLNDSIGKIVDEEIKLNKKGDISFLSWHCSVSFRISAGSYLTMILTSIDEPGVYRIDFILLGRGKQAVKDLRSKISDEVMRMEDRITFDLTDEELEEFKRISVSKAKVPHLHKEGIRQDDSLIGRLILDKIPMHKLEKAVPRLRKIIDKILSIIKEGTIKESYLEDRLERYDNAFHWVLKQFKKNPDSEQKLPKIKFSRLKKIWSDYAKSGVVRDVRGLDEIAELVLDNSERLRVNSILSGHSTISSRMEMEEYEDYYGKMTEEEWLKLYDHIEHVTDYGFVNLDKALLKIYNAKTPEEKLLGVDMALNVIHQSSDFAEVFIDGGSATLSKLAQLDVKMD